MNLRDLFSMNGVPAVTGRLQLEGVVVFDNVGHVRSESKRIVFDAYVQWVQMCLAGSPPPAPLSLPPAPSVPTPVSRPDACSPVSVRPRVSEDEGHFDVLARQPRGPKLYHRDNPQP